MASRFVACGALRLLFGPAPVTEDRWLEEYLIPHATQLGPGQELTQKVELLAPIAEYSVWYPWEAPLFFPDSGVPSVTPTRVDKIVVIMQYAPSHFSSMRSSPLDPQALDMATGAVGPGDLLSAYAEVNVPPFHVMRRNDRFCRVTLPGE